MIKTRVVEEPENIKPTFNSTYNKDIVKYEMEASKDFLPPAAAKEYQQLVKLLAVKSCTI